MCLSGQLRRQRPDGTDCTAAVRAGRRAKRPSEYTQTHQIGPAATRVRVLHPGIAVICHDSRYCSLSRLPLGRLSTLAFLGTCGVVMTATAACDRRSAVPHADSATLRSESRSTSDVVTENSSKWPSMAGAVLLVQGETREEAILLSPTGTDSVALASFDALARKRTEVTLFGRGGAILSAQLGPSPTSADAECIIWPLLGLRGAGIDTTWAVGFSGGQAGALALDSVEALSTRDSMALVAEASRLASAVTAPTAPYFQGLRFSAHDIRRFQASPGVEAIVAHLMRKVNQEANPQEEQTLLIAERDSGVTVGPYHLVYAERAHGLEESTTTPEVIGGVRIAGRPTLVVARDGAEGVAYALLERTATGGWRIRWTSALTRCG